MENDTRENYDQGNGNSQDDKTPNLFLENEGFPTYGKDGGSESDNSLSNYDDDKKNTELQGYPDQEGYTDDSDFGQNPNKHNPNPDEPDLDEDEDEDSEEDEEDTDIEEEDDSEDEIIPDDDSYPSNDNYPDDEINPDEKKDYYLKTNGKIYTVFFN
ncbi:MAG: hypothetical protein V4572_10440 [Bacteroidota bacterium]